MLNAGGILVAMTDIAEPRFIASEVADALGRLIGLIGLRPGWDDEGALAPDPDALRAAMLFLLEQVPSGPAPSVGPGVDGSIEMEWELTGRPSVAITFGPGKGALLAAFTPDEVVAEMETSDGAALATALRGAFDTQRS